MINFCLYHEGCFDGFTAAWAVWRKYQDWCFIPVNYGQPVPDLLEVYKAQRAAGSFPIPDPIDLSDGPVYVPEINHVVLVDFSYPPAELHVLADVAEFVTVIDHHKSAIEKLQGFYRPNVTMVLDVNFSGARLTWDHFHTGQLVPNLVEYVEDRDLWRWKLTKSQEINAWIRTLPFEFVEFDEAHVQLRHPEGFAAAVAAGDAVLRSDRRYVEAACKAARRITFMGVEVPIVNASILQSEIGNKLAEGHWFSLVWSVGADGRVLHSLRSVASGIDVSEIAKPYGGGGHRGAAGFITSWADSPIVRYLAGQ